jgi:hypothetical protein
LQPQHSVALLIRNENWKVIFYRLSERGDYIIHFIGDFLLNTHRNVFYEFIDDLSQFFIVRRGFDIVHFEFQFKNTLSFRYSSIIGRPAVEPTELETNAYSVD